MGRLPKGEGLHRGNDHNKLGPVLGCAAVEQYLRLEVCSQMAILKSHMAYPQRPQRQLHQNNRPVCQANFQLGQGERLKLTKRLKIYYKLNTGGDILELTRTLALIHMDLWLVIFILKMEST